MTDIHKVVARIEMAAPKAAPKYKNTLVKPQPYIGDGLTKCKQCRSMVDIELVDRKGVCEMCRQGR